MSNFKDFESLVLTSGLSFEAEISDGGDSQEPTIRIYALDVGDTRLEARIQSWDDRGNSKLSFQRFVSGRHKEKFFVGGDAKSLDAAKKRVAKLVTKMSK